MSLSPNLNELAERARQVIAAESAAVLSAAESVDQHFVGVVQVLLGCSGKVLITGSGTSGTIARRAAHLFSVGGTPAFYLSPDDGLHGGLGVLRKNDVVIAISKGGVIGGIESLLSESSRISRRRDCHHRRPRVRTCSLGGSCSAASPSGRIGSRCGGSHREFLSDRRIVRCLGGSNPNGPRLFLE
jgi:SIS domain